MLTFVIDMGMIDDSVIFHWCSTQANSVKAKSGHCVREYPNILLVWKQTFLRVSTIKRNAKSSKVRSNNISSQISLKPKDIYHIELFLNGHPTAYLQTGRRASMDLSCHLLTEVQNYSARELDLTEIRIIWMLSLAQNA
ncbi:hypothetical protein OCU04_006273 [Sclerotinia nivalis]|uniref:Uncharacterized protein n=1 Tax=Sclerotinia nivalis TaxID=352851 RepID=A0A9X0DL20_9HELO|nr:hypothetical protein OCU04_006273 [Sclerotinia nivalis]